MTQSADSLRVLPTSYFEDKTWRLPLDSWSDVRLFTAAAEVISAPKASRVDSFKLHAPLELVARMALLSFVPPRARPDARRRIASLAFKYANDSPDVAVPVQRFRDPETAWKAVRDGIAHQDPGLTDEGLCSLLSLLPAAAVCRGLINDVIDCTGAAGHVPILLAELPYWTERVPAVAQLLRAPLRVLAQESDRRVVWHASARAKAPRDGLIARLLTVPHVEASAPTIASLVKSVEDTGLMAERLDDVTLLLSPAEAEASLVRIAAWSMLQDAPKHAAYGWTHCMTIPRALLRIATRSRSPGAAVAVAASYVLAFRATLSETTLDPHWAPATATNGSVVGVDPQSAAAVAWHASSEERIDIVEVLAERAAIHPDAHLAKYTLTCLDAAAADPTEARLFVAAAAFLGAWWDEQGHKKS